MTNTRRWKNYESDEHIEASRVRASKKCGTTMFSTYILQQVLCHGKREAFCN